MAPTAFSFQGIKIVIYEEDHNPIHIHAKYQDFESVYELIIDNAKLVEINLAELDEATLLNIDMRTEANHNKALPPAQHKKVIKFLKKHWKEVVEKWVIVVVMKKRITLKRISGI